MKYGGVHKTFLTGNTTYCKRVLAVFTPALLGISDYPHSFFIVFMVITMLNLTKGD